MNRRSEDAVQTSTLPPAPNVEPVIVVRDLYKRYVRNEYRPSLRHEAGTVLKRMLGIASPHVSSEPFYALRNVNMDVHQGEAVALIGRNGSGKTTLLRVLSGITQPTSGTVEVRGRFASLISLSAGFSPEMTGRENIYLNAAIQGMPPAKVAPYVEDIIQFADIGQFIDLPVKRYSSGMYARLGFSIAIHIVPDIILVDEILAVGDAAFQAKCAERIQQFRREGRTFVIVTHSPATVLSLCDRAIWLHNG